MENCNVLDINKNPMLMCYSYLANMFSIIPFNSNKYIQQPYLRKMHWVHNNQIDTDYLCRLNNIELKKHGDETYINPKKYASNIHFKVYNIFTKNSKFIVNINYQLYTESYAGIGVYLLKMKDDGKIISYKYINDAQDMNAIEENRILFFFTYLKSGFYISKNGVYKKIDIQCKNKDYWMSIEVKDGELYIGYSNDNLTWIIVHQEQYSIDDTMYELGLRAFLGEEQFYPWLFMNFTQIYMPIKPYCADLPINYFFPQKKYYQSGVLNPFIDYNEITCKQIDENNVDIINFVKTNIDLRTFVYLYLNEFYINDRISYKNKIYNHANLIYGYNDEKQMLYLMGYNDGVLIYSELNYSDFFQAYKLCDRDGVDEADYLTLIRYNYHDFNYKFDIATLITNLQDYLLSYDSRERCKQIMQNDMDIIFGMSIYDNIINCNENLELFLDDIRVSHFIYEHKEIMKFRLDYLHINYLLKDLEYKKLIDSFSEISSLALMLRNVLIKNKMKSNALIIYKVKETLTKIRDMEYENIELLLKYLRGHTKKMKHPRMMEHMRAKTARYFRAFFSCHLPKFF